MSKVYMYYIFLCQSCSFVKFGVINGSEPFTLQYMDMHLILDWVKKDALGNTINRQYYCMIVIYKKALAR
jgi:hypothetical protein